MIVVDHDGHEYRIDSMMAYSVERPLATDDGLDWRVRWLGDSLSGYVDWAMVCQVTSDPLATARELKEAGVEFVLRDTEGFTGRPHTIMMSSAQTASRLGYFMWDRTSGLTVEDDETREFLRRKMGCTSSNGNPMKTPEMLDAEAEIVESIIEMLDD